MMEYDKILIDHNIFNEFMVDAKNRYISSVEFTHIINIIKSKYTIPDINNYIKENEDQIQTLKSIVNIPANISELGLTSSLAKLFHTYYTNNKNDDQFKKLIKYMIVTSIVNINNVPLFTTGNMFMGNNITFFLDKVVVNNIPVLDEFSEIVSTLGFIMLSCPLIFFMVPYNDYPKYDVSILHTGIYLYETITEQLNEVLLMLGLTLGQMLEKNFNDKNILFSELDLERFQGYYDYAPKFINDANGPKCDMVMKFDHGNNILNTIDSVESIVLNGSICHFGLDAMHLIAILGEFPISSDKNEYSKYFRNLLMEYVHNITQFTHTNTVTVVQLFVRIKMMYYEIYKKCYDEIKDRIDQHGFQYKLLITDPVLINHVDELIHAKYETIASVENQLVSSMANYKKKLIRKILDSFFRNWTTSEYKNITVPLIFHSEYHNEYLLFMDKLGKIPYKEFNYFGPKMYFFVVIVQYVMMESKKYNNANFEIYRGLKDLATDTDDKNNDFNEKLLMNLSQDIDPDFFLLRDNDNNPLNGISYMCGLMEEAFKIDPTNQSTTSRMYTNYFSELYTTINVSKTPKAKAGREFKELRETLTEETIENYIKKYIAYKQSEKKILENMKPVTTLFQSYKNKLLHSKYIYHQAFNSFTLVPEITKKFRNKYSCCTITTKLKPNLPYIYMAGLNEYEVLLPLFSKFRVINNDINDIQLDYLGSDFNISFEQFTECVGMYSEYVYKFDQSDDDFLKHYPSYKNKIQLFLNNFKEFYDKIKQDISITYGGHSWFKHKYRNFLY